MSDDLEVTCIVYNPEVTCIICLQREWTVLWKQTEPTGHQTGLGDPVVLVRHLKLCRPCADEREL